MAVAGGLVRASGGKGGFKQERGGRLLLGVCMGPAPGAELGDPWCASFAAHLNKSTQFIYFIYIYLCTGCR